MDNSGTHIRTLLAFLFCFSILLPAGAQDHPYPADTVLITEEGIREMEVNPPEPDVENEIFRFDQREGAGVLKEHTINDSLVSQLRRDGAFWYANKTPVREKPQRQFWHKEWFRSLMWFLMIGSFVAIIIWFLAASNISIFRKRVKTIDTGATEQVEEEDIFEINYNRAIARAVTSGDYNLAIRLHYLQVLKILSDRGIILYAQDKTNSDYVAHLHPTPFYKDFFRLTRQFDYAWYGRFPVSVEAYHTIENDFNDFKKFVAR